MREIDARIFSSTLPLPATPTKLFFSGRVSVGETLSPFLRGLENRWRIRGPFQRKTATPINKIKSRIQRLVDMV
jgi:hypothetical protein